MSIFDFKQRFGQQIGVEEIKESFVIKINHFLFPKIDRYIEGEREWKKRSYLFDKICLSLNREPEDVEGHRRYHGFPTIKELTDNNFMITLIVIEAMWEFFNSIPEEEGKEYLENIDKVVSSVLGKPFSLGISWYSGKFYPEDAGELTEKMVHEVNQWLEDYPKVKLIFENALDHYSKSLGEPIKRKDVISNSFQAVEELTKAFLDKNKSFDNNFSDLVEKLKLNKHWRQILNHYKELSKEFGRHSGRDKKFIPEQSDTEAFLYLSGLIIRLILEKLKKIK